MTRLISLILLSFLYGSVSYAQASPERDVEKLFYRYVEAQNAHNEQGVSDILLNSPNFLSVTLNGVSLWGQDLALSRFRANWAGAWKLEPVEGTLRVIEVNKGTAVLNTRLLLTVAPPGETAQQVPIKWNGVFTHTDSGWRLASIIQVPMP